MKESTVEAYLRDEVKKIGGKAYKFVSPGNTGVPDRLVVIPNRPAFFVETKATGKKSTALQMLKQAELRRMGSNVYSEIDCKTEVDSLLKYERGQIDKEAAQ